MGDTPHFEDSRVQASRSVLVDVLTVLAGDLRAIAIVGGWVPELVFPGEGHIGSLDVDLALDGRLIKPAAYNTIRDKLLKAGYEITDVEADALAISTAAGTIHCWSAGNRSYDCNLKDLQNEPGAITVSALGSDGQYSNYSEFGACVFVTAPSDSFELLGITTTDRTTETNGYNGSLDDFPDPNYTSMFGGTSSASPLVAGVLALAKQVQPALDTRFAKHLLARTSDIVDSDDSTPESDGGWRTNAAGFHFNQRYGFGLIDADDLTEQALIYNGVTPLVTQSTGTIAVNQTLADAGSHTVQFNLSASQPMEEVLVTLDFEVFNPYTLKVNLIAPSGYRTRLINPRNITLDNPRDPITWRFCTNALWGESPAGTWTLEVEDTVADGHQVTWNSHETTVRMGTLTYNDCIATPANVSATDGTGEQIQVTWSAVSGATQYRVYRPPRPRITASIAMMSIILRSPFRSPLGRPRCPISTAHRGRPPASSSTTGSAVPSAAPDRPRRGSARATSATASFPRRPTCRRARAPLPISCGLPG